MKCTSCQTNPICRTNQINYPYLNNGGLCDECFSIAIDNRISAQEIEEIYKIKFDTNKFDTNKFNYRTSKNVVISNRWDILEETILHNINEITGKEQKEYSMNIYNIYHKFRLIKKYIIQTYYKHMRCVGDLIPRPILYREFGCRDYVKFNKLITNFTESNDKIANEYAFSSAETEEEVKIRLDENFRIYSEMENSLRKKVDLVYKLMDEEIQSLIQLDGKFKDIYQVYASKYHERIFFEHSKLFTAAKIETCVYTIDPIVCTLNDIKKTDVMQVVINIAKDAIEGLKCVSLYKLPIK